MVNVGKREDGLIDWANGYKGKFDMLRARIAMYRETPLTANELMILNTLSDLLEEEKE